MNKFLRYSFVVLLAMVMGKLSAQEVTLDFTLTDAEDTKVSLWEFPAGSANKTVEEKSFTYGGYTVKVAGSEGEGYYWHNKDHYLLFGKQGAKLTLPAFGFDVERIEIEGNSGASAGVKQNIYVGENAVSTETTGAQGTNIFDIAANYQAAGNIYVIMVNSKHNNQIKTIKIWKKGTSGGGSGGGDDPTPETKKVNVAEALNIINALEDGKTTAEEYQVKGFVVGTPDFQRDKDDKLYGNVNLNIADEKGGSPTLTVFRGKDLENKAFTEETISSIKENDEVVFQGKLQKYVKNGTMTPELTNGYVISVNSGGETPTTSRSWDFTKWSDATVANLIADAKASKTSGWSDIEKKDVAEADGDPTDTSKDNCFWYAGLTNEDGSLSANGVVIKELEGLVFSNKYAPNRSLAIAVNYPVALSEYAGGAYLWLGGGKKKVPCFTIPNVTAGSKITMEVESHKTSEGRGVELYTGLVADGSTVDDATKIGESFTPKEKDSYTWTIENDCDVIVYNTNGCHIYSITIEETGGAPVNPDEAVKEAPTGWILAVTNGNLAGDDVSSYYAKEAPSTTPTGATIVDGAGVNNSRGIVVKSQDKEKEAWDTQFWIKVNEPLASGTKIHVEFDYKADKAGKVGTQAHGEPGNYQHFVGIGDVTFDTEWKHFDTDFEVSGDMATGNGGNGLISFAFNLNDIAEANTFYFDNFGVWYQKPAPVEKWADLIVNGNMEGECMECFYVTEQGVGGPFVAVATDGIGKDGSKAVKIQSADNPGQDWDTQFFIRLPYELPAGTKFKVSFDYKADKAGDADTQSHNEPGQYIHWACCGSPSFTTDWQTYTNEGTVASQCNGEAADGGFLKNFQTIAFNLAKNKVATEFIIDNVKFEVEESIVATLTKSPAENPTPYPVGIMTVNAEKQNGQYFDLQGRRVANPAKGLYIINGKKIMVK